MSACETFGSRLADAVALAPMSAAAGKALEAHVAGCPACAARLTELVRLEDRLRSVGAARPALGSAARDSLATEFLRFWWAEPQWWAIPATVVVAALGAILVFAEGSAIAPFIYSLF